MAPSLPERQSMTYSQKAKAGIPAVPYYPKGIEHTFHASVRCEPEPCILHDPTNHKMSTWPINIRETSLAERFCVHDIGHPDPDSIAWLDREGPPGAKGTWGVHGCDGCCG